MEGTSIHDLKGSTNCYDDIRGLQETNQSNYNLGQNMQREQGHNAAHMMHQAQHMPYYRVDSNGQLQFIKPGVQQGASDVEDLAKDLNDNLPDTFVSVSEVEEGAQNGRFGILSSIPEMFRDPLIILVLYIILSLPAVREGLGTYISQINPDVEGKVSFTGILIYGIILVALFMLVKRFL
jgi:hypothetical protein